MYILLTLCLANSPAVADELEVLHWWTSDGETSAADYLRNELKQNDITWIDAAIPGGGGEGAMAVLKSRVLQGAAPAAAQIIGPDIQKWASLNFLGHFNIVALTHNWPNILHPTVDRLIQYQNQYVAVPFGIHRINWLWINKNSLEQTGLGIPTNWPEFFQLAEAFKKIDIVPLIHGNEPWQNATIFEALVLSIGGSQFYHQVFIEHSEAAILSEDFAQTLALFGQLKSVMDNDINGRSWHQATKMLASGEAGMQIMGDWVKGELYDWEKLEQVICTAVPGTQGEHLYSIDTMVMFNNPGLSSYEAQLKFAEVVVNTDVQLNYNKLKGAVPIRNDIEIDLLDDCAQSSYSSFLQNESTGTLAPSLAHSMAANAEVEDVFVKVLHNFFQSPEKSISLVQHELVRNLKSIRD